MPGAASLNAKLMNSDLSLVATTYAGLEDLLVEELQVLGAIDISKGRRMVSFRGDKKLLYNVNYLSRFTLRLLWQVDAFSIKDQNDYYSRIRAIDWEQYLSPQSTLAIQAVTSGEILPHSRFAAQRAKDAIVDHFREKTGQRPSVDLERPDIRINVHLRNDQCHISLDSSGEPLHKRGWRAEMGIAPLSEILAAALVKLSGWKGEGEFLDPMCGSGTIAIEAAMQALQIPAGKYRRFYGFLKWNDFDRDLWQSIKEEADQRILPERDLLIRASDASWRAIEAARKNLEKAHLTQLIQLEKKPFQAVYPRKPQGVIITNPPYDERIKSKNNTELYQAFGDVLKQRYQDHSAWVFSGDLNALKRLGLKPSERHILFNGPIECRYVRYDLFLGSQEKVGETGHPGAQREKRSREEGKEH